MLRLFAVSTVLLPTLLQGEVTYSKEVSRILQAKCQQCHRPNDVAPFALTSYDEARRNGRAIRSAVQNRVMPPWKPVEGVNSFRDSYNLSADERKTIIDWIDAGMPEGDKADLPEPLAETGEWQLGEPDMVVQIPQPFEIPAGKDTYRCFVLPTELTETKWIRAIQVAPGSRDHVHHVLLFLDTTNASARYDGKDGRQGYDCFGGPGDGVAEEAGGILGGWAPGVRAMKMPEGVAEILPSRARIVIQVHYHGHADHVDADTDQTKVGLYFTEPPARQLVYLPVDNERFSIPAGESNYPVTAQASMRLPFRLELLTVAPHMHLLGRTIRVEKIAGGVTEPLIYIDDWDFNWQAFYTFEKPVAVEGATTIRVSCTYDNSDKNPRNPNQPPKTVTYGENTTDEMCLALVGLAVPPGLLSEQVQP